MSDMRPPITAGPIARAFKFLKSTSVNCGAVAEGDGVAADDEGGVALAGEVTGEAAAAGEGFDAG